MSPLDEGFRTRLNRIYGAWRSEVARALENGQRKGFVRPEVAPFQTAAFVVAAVEGIFGTTKNAQSDELFRVSMEGLKGYIATLRWEREAA